MRYAVTVRLLTTTVFLLGSAQLLYAQSQLDTQGIEQALGVPGKVQGDVYKVGLPRTDLNVSVEGLRIQPRFALGSWVAFKARGDAAVAHGDLVLLEKEVASVMERLQEQGITFTALHNHLIRESPKVMYLHFWAEGPAQQIAIRLREALALTGTPLQKGATAKDTKPAEAIPAQRIEELLGTKGTTQDGVLSVSVPRLHPVTMNDIELPPSMGMATAINFQAGQNGKIAATGDFVLLASEVNAVASRLIRHGLQVTALHNHLVHGSPELYFLHFWGYDTVEAVARGLKAALDVTKEKS
jgi:hypothetical protein